MSITVGVLGVLSTAILGLVAYRLSSVSQRYQARRAIGDLHSRMAHLRCEYPAIRTVCVNWDDHLSKTMYLDRDLAMQSLAVRYETYVDIGLEFCNTTLGARTRRVLHKADFESQYRPLVHLFLAENWPFIRHALEGRYISRFIRDEVSAQQRAGFDWAAAHRRVTAATPSAE